ncbi:hypothetical protein [Haladaptatus halobius]|jgi:uncharacterized membrane protein|uniref:hypothetical protein n=1 Tax=Haladaptatus halobius TaxID=2884875 RepID=UPI001D09A0BE|nr:hypothetical protein [Haladaptatus halobius]
MSPERTETYLVAIVTLLAVIASLLAGVVTSLGTPAMATAALVFVLFAVVGVVAYDMNRRSA